MELHEWKIHARFKNQLAPKKNASAYEQQLYTKVKINPNHFRSSNGFQVNCTQNCLNIAPSEMYKNSSPRYNEMKNKSLLINWYYFQSYSISSRSGTSKSILNISVTVND